PQHVSIDDLHYVWRVAEDAGFDHLWDFDHFNPIVGELGGPVFEGWTLLAAMAECTKRVRIGCMVTGNTYRHPAVLAKMAVTIDHLSGGRLEFGIGAGWAEAEHRMLGLEFYTTGRRIRRLREAVQLCKALWTQPEATFEGRDCRLDRPLAEPKPVQKPHPPVWIRGAGEPPTLRLGAGGAGKHRPRVRACEGGACVSARTAAACSVRPGSGGWRCTPAASRWSTRPPSSTRAIPSGSPPPDSRPSSPWRGGIPAPPF